MAEMNRGMKKLIALLEKEVANLGSDLAKSLLTSVFKSAENYTKGKNNLTEETNINFIKELIEIHADRFVETAEEDMYLKVEMTQVLKWLQNKEIFVLFDSLDDIFDYFDFPIKHQLDVLGYIIKNNAEVHKIAVAMIDSEEKSLKEDEEYASIFKQEIDMFKSHEILKKVANDLVKQLNEGKFAEFKKDIIEKYDFLESLLDCNCRFKASTELFEIHDALKKTLIGLTARQEKLIIWDVSEKQLRKFDEEFEKEIEKETIKGRVYETNVDLNKKNKEQNVAEHELKKYLVDDSPVSFVDELMFEEIKRLMNQAGYTEERINKVVKNIVNSNQSLYEQDSISKFKLASSNYLTVEEQEILSNAEQILNNKDALVNPSFNTILENYNIVKEEIVTVSDEEDEALELVRYAIEEIRNTVIEYSYSDYRVTRILKENKK